MKRLYEFLSVSGIKTHQKFPEKPIVDDVKDFLDKQKFKMIAVKRPLRDIDDNLYYDEFFTKLEKESKNDPSYYMCFYSHDVPFSEIYFFRGGEISEDNPLYDITVFNTEKDIDDTYYSGERFTGKNEKEKKQYRTYDEFVDEIMTFFGW